MKENNEKSDNLIEKVKKMMSDYTQATGSSICIYDSDCKPFFPDNFRNDNPEKTICPYCNTTDCNNLHKNSINEAIKKGGLHIYTCNMGLVFWISPIYTNGSFSGAIRGSGFLQERKKDVDIFANANNTHNVSNEKMAEEAKERVNSLPKADDEKIQSLAEMMQICAESLSSGSEDYHEILRRRSEQQEAIKKIIAELEKAYPENTEKPGYSLEKEKILLNTLRKGDPLETRRQLNELIAAMIFSYRDQFKYMQLRTTELVVLFSRIEVGPVKNGSLSLEINNQCLKLIQDSKNTEELTDILHTVADRILSNITSFRGIPHAAALRKAENFIMENYTRKISLKEIADMAGLSPPYFSTIFKEEMGENLSKYLNRLRVEKASRLLLETDMSLSEIAACCCFEDQSWFSKIFKAFTGISPGKYRNQGGGIIRTITENNLSQAFRKTLKK
ncbi:MAG: helix-turn-helix domain-containing protein [Treponema sp.]|jgi:AraC-like DNA-binding protein/ligand-binding sensor protein|nr:helix-turn-helix domain-containing protein [Treponema sp.]